MAKGEPVVAGLSRHQHARPRLLWLQVPPDLTATLLLHTLGTRFGIARDRPVSSSCRFFDTFDWRLYGKGSLVKQEAGAPAACWQRLQDEELIAWLPQGGVPRFARQLPPGALRHALGNVLEHRALLPVVDVSWQASSVRVLNEDRKTVARLTFMDRVHASSPCDASAPTRPLPSRLGIFSVKGYLEAFHTLASVLRDECALAPATPLGVEAATAMGRTPGDYASRFELTLHPVDRADDALRAILRMLTETMERNLPGLLADVDTEFLHDFRVAVRRTRVALSQVPYVFPDAAQQSFAAAFKSLHQATGPTRDLDVYLLQIIAYQDTLPAVQVADLDPLRTFLQQKQRAAQEALHNVLTGSPYRTLLASWKAFLAEPAPGPLPPHATRPVVSVASACIWRQYKKVRKQGRAIGADAPLRELHALRLRCKKLRYLLELFRSLYPGASVNRLIRALKRLQDNLGDLQDLQVQRTKLRQYADAMLAEGCAPAATLLTMGRLASLLEARQHEARAAFAPAFAKFDRKKNRRLFAALFREHLA